MVVVLQRETGDGRSNEQRLVYILKRYPDPARENLLQSPGEENGRRAREEWTTVVGSGDVQKMPSA